MRKLLILAITAAFISCGSTKSLSTLAKNDWQLYSLDNTLFKLGEGMKMPKLSFDTEKMTVSGNTGCNSLSGPVEIKSDKLSFGTLATTRMACEGYNPETKFLEALSKTKKFSFYENKLVLKDKEGNETMVLEPQLRPLGN